DSQRACRASRASARTQTSSQTPYARPGGRARTLSNRRNSSSGPLRFQWSIVDVDRRAHLHVEDTRHGVDDILFRAEGKITHLHQEALCQVVYFPVLVPAHNAPRDEVSVAFLAPSALCGSEALAMRGIGDIKPMRLEVRAEPLHAVPLRPA